MTTSVVPPPPRSSLNAEEDLPKFINYLETLFKGFEQLSGVQAALAAGFDPSILPDPDNTSLAQAQQVANLAYAQAFVNAAELAALEFGSITIANTDTAGDFTFAFARIDTSYFAIAQVSGSTGGIAAGARTVTSVTKATDKVTINLLAAPGAGTDVTFDIVVGAN